MMKVARDLIGLHDGECALILAICGMKICGTYKRNYPDVDEALAYFYKGKMFIGEMHYPSEWGEDFSAEAEEYVGIQTGIQMSFL